MLIRGSLLVFSLPHPAYDMIDDDHPLEPLRIRRFYFDREPLEYEWNGVAFTDYRDTISDLVTGLVRTGYRIDTILEPAPLPSGPPVDVLARDLPVRPPHPHRPSQGGRRPDPGRRVLGPDATRHLTHDREAHRRIELAARRRSSIAFARGDARS